MVFVTKIHSSVVFFGKGGSFPYKILFFYIFFGFSEACLS